MSNFNPNFPVDGFPLDNFQPFLQNWSALDTVFSKDHTLFSDANTENQGHHKQVFYYAPQAAPAPLPTGTQAAAFPKASVAPAPIGITQEVFQNVNGLYILSCIKAWGIGGFGAGVSGDGFNVASITNPSIGHYNVTFTTPLPNANYAVLVTSFVNSTFANGSIIGYDNRTVNGFEINARSAAGASGAIVQFSFMVLQT